MWDIPWGNFFLWQEISYCKQRFLLVRGNTFLWQEVFSCNRINLPVTGNFLLRKDIFLYRQSFLLIISFWGRIILLLSGNFCNFSTFWCKVLMKVHDFRSYLKIVTKVSIFAKNLAWDLMTSWQDSFHLAR